MSNFSLDIRVFCRTSGNLTPVLASTKWESSYAQHREKRKHNGLLLPSRSHYQTKPSADHFLCRRQATTTTSQPPARPSCLLPPPRLNSPARRTDLRAATCVTTRPPGVAFCCITRKAPSRKTPWDSGAPVQTKRFNPSSSSRTRDAVNLSRELRVAIPIVASTFRGGVSL